MKGQDATKTDRKQPRTLSDEPVFRELEGILNQLGKMPHGLPAYSLALSFVSESVKRGNGVIKDVFNEHEYFYAMLQHATSDVIEDLNAKVGNQSEDSPSLDEEPSR